MRRWGVALIGLTVLAGSTLSWAETEVDEQMSIIARNYRSVLKADTAESFNQGLAVMRAAALEAQQNVPSKLENEAPDSAKMKDFRHGLDTLVSEIDGATALAKAGKLDEAKKAAEGFKATRDEYHEKYK